MSLSLLERLQSHASAAGLNLFGAVDCERFDASQPPEARCGRLVPGSGTALVFGSGGRALWRALASPATAPPPPQRWRLPLQAHTVGVVRRVQALLREQEIDSHLITIAAGTPINFVQLSEAAGFGTVSPVIGMLLHPVFGPWLCVRAALLLPGKPFGPIADASLANVFQPCCGCPRPCLGACPAVAKARTETLELEHCLEHRHGGGCRTHCMLRRACPIGQDQGYDEREEAHRQAETWLLLEQRLGLGVWRFLQRLLWR